MDNSAEGSCNYYYWTNGALNVNAGRVTGRVRTSFEPSRTKSDESDELRANESISSHSTALHTGKRATLDPNTREIVTA